MQRDFVVLTLFSALPTKLVLGGLFFYLVPLYLTDLGNAQSNVGRIMMVFGIACVVITPLAARRSDRLDRPRTLITLGGLVVGLGCLLPALAGSTEDCSPQWRSWARVRPGYRATTGGDSEDRGAWQRVRRRARRDCRLVSHL